MAFPFLAKIGYAPIAAFPFSARIGYAPIAAFPFSARIGYAPVVEGSSAVLSVLSQREKDRRTSVIMHRVAKSHTAGILRHGAVHYQRLYPRSQMRRSSPKNISKQIIGGILKKSKQITSIERVLVAQWKFLFSAFYAPRE